MRNRVAILACLFVVGTLLVVDGCTKPSEPGFPAQPQGGPGTSKAGTKTPATPAPAEATGTQKATGSKAPASGAASPVPQGIKDLEAKIQPGGPSAKPASKGSPAAAATPGNEELRTLSATVVNTFVKALAESDQPGAEKLLFSRQDFEKYVKSGFRDILQGNVLAANTSIVKKLIQQLGGKKLQHAWKPGDLVRLSGKNLFLQPFPTFNKGTLTITTPQGVHVEVRVDQLVYVEGAWKIFRLSLP